MSDVFRRGYPLRQTYLIVVEAAVRQGRREEKMVKDTDSITVPGRTDKKGCFVVDGPLQITD